MSLLDDKINSLSSDELDTLNSDPQMLAQFKAKYAVPASQGLPKGYTPTTSDIAERSPNYPTAKQTDIGPSDILNVMGTAELAKGGLELGKTLATTSPAEIASILKTAATDFSGYIKNLFTKPATDAELSSATSAVTDAIKEARQKVGAQLGTLRGTQQTGLERLGDIAEKGIEASVSPQEAAKNVTDYLESLPQKNAPVISDAVAGATTHDITAEAPALPKAPYTPGTKAIEQGDIVTLKSTDPTLPDVNAMHNGTTYQLKDSIPETDPARINERLQAAKTANENFGVPMPEGPLLRHGINTDIGPDALKAMGYQIPERLPYTNPKEELQDLIEMKGDLYDQIGRKTLNQSGAIVPAVSSNDERAFKGGIAAINQRMENIPGGSEIRDKERQFSQLADIYDNLQSKLQQPEQAKQFLSNLFSKPKGKNLDYLNQLKQFEQTAGTDVVSKLQDAFESTKGLTYEQLKHSIASLLKAGLPVVGSAARGIGSTIKAIGTPALKAAPYFVGAQALQKPFNTPEMQSLRDRLKNETSNVNQ